MEKVSENNSERLPLPPIGTSNHHSEVRSSDPGSSSDVNKGKGKSSDSHGDESKLTSNTEDYVNLNQLINKKKIRARWQIALDDFLENLYVQIVLSIINVFALFADDIRCLCFGKSSDVPFYATLCVVMGIFILEIILCSICKLDYFLSLYFWIDVVSTISLVGDIGWIIPTGSAAGKASGIVKKARVTKVVRVVRLIRLIRLLRISKLYKEVQKQKAIIKERSENRRRSSRIFPGGSNLPIPEETARSLLQQRNSESLEPVEGLNRQKSNISNNTHSTGGPKESKVSQVLTELTMQRVVMMVVVMVFCLPLLLTRTWVDQPFVANYASYILDRSYDIVDEANPASIAEFKLLCQRICDDNKEEKRYPLIYISGPYCGPEIFKTDPDDLRDAETIESEEGEFTSIFDYRPYTRIAAALNLCQTLYICILLTIAAILFSNDANNLLLRPLENIMEKVNKLSHDPMWFCLATSDDDLGIYAFMKKQEGENTNSKDEKYETQYLESLIVKIAKLLAVEFGA